MRPTVINTYLFNHLVHLHYFPFFFIISHYFFIIIIIVISLLKVVHMQLWHCFDTMKLHILVLLLFLWGPQTVWFVILHLENTAHRIFGGYVWHRWNWGHLKSPIFTVYTFGFIVKNSSLYLPKLLNYSCINNSHILSLFSIEFPASVNGISAVFHAIHHCTVVGTLTFIFLRYMFDPFTCSSNHPLCVGWSVLCHHTLGWHTLGWSAFIRCAVFLFQLVKQDGWLREEVIACCKSDSICSGKVSQLPFNVEITPQVLVLLCFIGVCLFLGDFHRFLAV